MHKYYLSIDIGGTNIKSALLNRAGNIIEKHKTETPIKSLAAFKAKIEKIITKARPRIRGVVFSVPGKVDVKTGTVYHGGSLPFLDHVNFRQLFGEDNNLPIAVENDGKAAALAELWLGNLNGISSGAAIVLGTGVGGGLILDGKLYYGDNLMAGEFSFILNDYELDDYMVESVGMNLSAVQMVKTISEKLRLADPLDGRAVFEYINRKDPQAWPIFTHYCKYIAKLILSLQAILDVKRYVIGGGISAQPIVTETVTAELAKIMAANPLVHGTLGNIDVRQAKFGNDANLFGALYSHLLQIE